MAWEKQLISNQLRKLRKQPSSNPEEIAALEKRYAELDEPQRLKRQQGVQAFYKTKRDGVLP